MQLTVRASLALALAMPFGVLTFGADQSQKVSGDDPSRRAWTILEEGTSAKSFSKRSEAVRVLGLLPGDPKAIAMTEKALADPAPEVRRAAATALGQMHSLGSFLKLEHALDDKDISVVLAAAHALWLIQDKRAYDVYYEILLGERKSGEGLIKQQEKMLRDPKKLAELGFEEGIGFVPFAGIGWGAFKTIHKDSVSPVRATAARVLADDPDPRSGEALVRATAEKSWIVRAAALDAITRRGDPALLKKIEPRLYDEKDIVRYTAAAAVIRLGPDLKNGRQAPEPGGPPPAEGHGTHTRQ